MARCHDDNAMTIKGRVEALVQRVAFRLLGITRFYEFCKAIPPDSYTPETGSRVLIDLLRVKVEWSGAGRDTIPGEGQPLLVVANHPFGLVEALALDSLLLSRRKDVTFIAWHFIGELPRMGKHYIYVDPMRGAAHRKRNIEGWRRSLQWLANGGVLGVFPAGQVARFDWSRRAVVDPPWNPHIGRVARRTRVPVLPVFFYGRNSLVFQLAAMVFPTLHQSLVIREVSNKRDTTIRARIGEIIRPEELAGFATDEEAIAFLRHRTLALSRAAL